jgi:ribosomal protein S18 acetylase RimI-like enzyme
MDIIQADFSKDSHTRAILNLLNIYAKGITGGREGLSDYTKKNLINELKLRPNCLVLLAFDNSTPAGLMIGFEGFSTFACKPLLNIHDIVVAPEYRRQGLAVQLLKRAEMISSEKDYCKITLEVLEGNEAAKSVYLKFGFEPYELNHEMGRALFWEKKL